MSILIFILILIALIWVHELGHFSVAKLFGVRVDEFSIGFPPRLLKFRYGETLYSFGALLVGGFVRIWGEQAGEGAGDPRALTAKPRYVQALVLAAGIVFNILFAWLVLSAGYLGGMPASTESAYVGQVEGARTTAVSVLPDSPAALSGMQGGDIIVGVQTGTEALSGTITADALRNFIAAHEDESIVFALERGGERETVLARAEEGIIEGRKAIGVQLSDVGTLTLPPHLALVQGGMVAANLVVATAQGLGAFFAELVTGEVNWNNVAGPIGIATVGGEAVETGFSAVIFITALISINLGLINLLPIPGLDGGRLFILAIEGVKGSPLPERYVTGLTLAGFALLIGLMIYVSVHDIARLIN